MHRRPARTPSLGSAANGAISIAESEGSGAERVDNWTMTIPDARGQLIEINGIELRVPDFLGMMAPLIAGGIMR